MGTAPGRESGGERGLQGGKKRRRGLHGRKLLDSPVEPGIPAICAGATHDLDQQIDICARGPVIEQQPFPRPGQV